jgi:aminoglycoside 3-N-acetyltransferase
MTDQGMLEAQLRRIGLGAGDRVVVHSSMREMGPIDGGAEAVVTAFLDVLGPGGLLVAPTFNFRETRFDPDATPSRMGRITETVRGWPGAARSWHPTHAVAAIGPDAAALCEGHHLVGGGLSIGSPLDRLAASGGWVLLIGVGHNRNSTVHVGEAHARVPYLRLPSRAQGPFKVPMTVRGQQVMADMREIPGCSESFGAVEGALRRRGFIRDGMIGKASAQLMRGTDLIRTVVDLVSAEPGLLLCTSPDCAHCTESRQLLNERA